MEYLMLYRKFLWNTCLGIETGILWSDFNATSCFGALDLYFYSLAIGNIVHVLKSEAFLWNKLILVSSGVHMAFKHCVWLENCLTLGLMRYHSREINRWANKCIYLHISFVSLGLIMVLAGASEFDPQYNKDATSRPTDNILIPQVSPIAYIPW